MKLKTIAKAVLLNPQGEVLILRRSPTDNRRPGELDFPGGGVDPGEDLTAAAVREIEEEAGITIELGALALIYAATELETRDNEKTTVNRLLYLGRVNEEQANAVRLSYEHDKYDWLSVDKALQDFQHPFYNAGLAFARDNDLL